MNGQVDHLAWLMSWYASQCDGDWEHSYGLKIETLDNPGWILTVDLTGTTLESALFQDHAEGIEDRDTPLARWNVCRVRQQTFEGFGGPFDLEAIIACFRRWAESSN